MTIFKDKLDAEHVTVAEVKDVLEAVEEERALDEDREMRYELARAIEHVNEFAHLDAEEAADLVLELRELEKVDEETAFRIADLQPADRTELRSLYAQQRYALDGEELDAILNVVAKYV